MRILAIETSCDDTCLAIVEASEKKRLNFKILSNVVSSQIKIHKKWGGVWPSLAKREHQRNLVPILKQALMESRLLNSKFKIQNSKLQLKIQKLEKILEREPDLLRNLAKFLKKYKKPKIDLIAITVGPGLEPCLWTGVNFAKALGFFWNLKILPMNHIEAHIYANFLNQNLKSISPAICLVVSGGHSQLILMGSHGKYQILGETRDDAAGECLDKIARILGLSYPGGPVIAKKAAKIKSDLCKLRSKGKLKIKLPRPMFYSKDYDFSFSGLKTAVFYLIKKLRKISEKEIVSISAETQQSIIDVLIKKTLKATRDYNAKSVILGGGVSANDELRRQFQSIIENQKLRKKFLVPQKKLCTDNALMVGICAYYHWLKKKGESWEKIKVDANLRIS